MNIKKYILLLALPLFSLVLLSYNSVQQPNSYQSPFDLNKYNAISKIIDSLNNLIVKEEQALRTINNEIENLASQKAKLIAACESTLQETQILNINTLPESLFNCDTLKLTVKRIDKTIKEKSDKIAKINQSIKAHQEKVIAHKKQLQNESKSLVTAIKNHNGSLHFNFKDMDYHVFIANTDNDEIKMHWLNKDRRIYANIRNLFNELKKDKKQPLMITNAGMYTPELKPQGLYIDKFGNELRPLDLKSSKTQANFYLKPNGVYYIDTFGISHIKTTDEFKELYECNEVPIKYATQSGPMLLINGSIHSAFIEGSANRKIRSGVGIINEKRTVFAISLDETNFYDFAVLFRDIFGCKDALYLDGAISLMYLHDIAPNELGGQFGAMISVTSKKDK